MVKRKNAVMNIMIFLSLLFISGCSKSQVSSSNNNSSITGQKTYKEVKIKSGERLEKYLSLELTFQYNSNKNKYDKALATVVGISNYQYVNAEITVYFSGLLYGGTFSINSSGSGQKTLDCSVNNTTLVQQGKYITAAKNFIIKIPN